MAHEEAAEAGFAAYLLALREDRAADFDAFCAARPEIADRLRLLHDVWRRQTTATMLESSPGDAARPISHVLREFFGNERPDVEIAPEEGAAGDQSLSTRLKRLAERIALTARYSLQEEVARGGMGVILRVWDEDLRRTLAMKSMRGKLRPEDRSPENAQTVSRFLEEAQITGQLDHPGVVPVHELGIDAKGHVFFTMRMVKGVELSEVFRLSRAGEEGWNTVRCLGVILKVCEAMAYAHSKGVIHRDLKPANVMVGKFGETYVMDWGLAKVVGRKDSHDLRVDPMQSVMLSGVKTDRTDQIAISDRSEESPLLTMDGTVVGTPTYMPPEQAEGRVADLDFRADIYSLGALLYTLLTGRMPYVEPGAPTSAGTVLTRLLSGPPTPIHQIDKTVAPELAAVCEKAMARKPDDRYPTVDAMAEDLRAYLEGRVVRAYQTGALAEFRKWVRRNRTIAASILGLVVTAIVALSYVAWQDRRKVREIGAAHEQTVLARDRARASEREARASEREARLKGEEAERKSYLASLAAADASLRVHETSEARLRLDACPEALRGWEWRHLRLRSDTSLARLEGHHARVTAVAFSADGTLLASGSDDRTVKLWDVASGAERLTLPAAMEGAASGGVSAVAFRPDGTRLAAACDDKFVRLWDPGHGGLVGIASGHETAVTCLAYRGDGDLFATGSTDETVRFWNGANAQPVGEPYGAGAPVYAVAFHPDGNRLAVAAEDAIQIVDVGTRTLLATIEGDGTTLRALAFDAQGTRLAAGALDATVRLYDVEGGKRVKTLEGHTDPVYALRFNATGTRLFTASFDKTIRLWDARAGAPLRALVGHTDAVHALAISPAGGTLASASADGTLRLWDLARSNAVLEVRGEDDLFNGLAADPGADRLAATAAGVGSVRLWDSVTGESLATVGGDEGTLASVAFSPSGSRVAGAGEEDWKIRLWNVEGSGEEKVLEGHEGPVTSIAFVGGDGRLVSGSADMTVRLWDLAGSAPPVVLAGHKGGVTCVTASASGDRLLSASEDGTVRVWEAATGRLLATLEGHGGAVRAVARSADGALYASGGDDETIRLWDSATFEPAGQLSGHTGPVQALAFSPDSTRLASGGRDKTIRLWDPATREMLLRIAAHDNWVTALAFTRDGASIASSSFDGTLRVFRTRLPAAR